MVEVLYNFCTNMINYLGWLSITKVIVFKIASSFYFLLKKQTNEQDKTEKLETDFTFFFLCEHIFSIGNNVERHAKNLRPV